MAGRGTVSHAYHDRGGPVVIAATGDAHAIEAVCFFRKNNKCIDALKCPCNFYLTILLESIEKIFLHSCKVDAFSMLCKALSGLR